MQSAAKQIPHGGTLIDLILTQDAEKTRASNGAHHVLQLNDRQLCDVELIMNGGFSPLTGFMVSEWERLCLLHDRDLTG